MRKFLTILIAGVTALALTIPIGAGTVGAQAPEGTFCAGVVSTLDAFGGLAVELNLEGYGEWAGSDGKDPKDWPQGFFPSGTADEVDQELLDELIATISAHWALALDKKGEVPAEVGEAFQVLYDAFGDLGVYDALAEIVEVTWLELSGGPGNAETVDIAAILTGALAALGTDLATEAGIVLDYIASTTDCPDVDPVDPPVTPVHDATPKFTG